MIHCMWKVTFITEKRKVLEYTEAIVYGEDDRLEASHSPCGRIVVADSGWSFRGAGEVTWVAGARA